MIQALNWAMRLTTDVITTNEKIVLIGLADVCDFLYHTQPNKTKLLKFTCLSEEQLDDAINILLTKGFIKQVAEKEHRDTLDLYKLIVSF